MAQNTVERVALVLGAGGKVGRLVRRVWANAPLTGLRPVPVFRRDMGLPGQVVWSPGQPFDVLPRADVVIALWGVTPGPGADLTQNTELAICAMRVARAVGADRVLHCSSAAVYAPGLHPQDEDTPPAPTTDYGRAKLAMEHALSAVSGIPRAICLRIGNVAGAESLFAAMSNAQEVTLDRFGDGHGPDRSYIAPSNLAQVLAALATAPLCDLPGIVNVAAPRATAMEAIARAAGRQVHWRPAPEGAARRIALDTGRLDALCPRRIETADPDHLVSDWLRWKEAE